MRNTPLNPLSRGEFGFCYFNIMLNLTALPLSHHPEADLREADKQHPLIRGGEAD